MSVTSPFWSTEEFSGALTEMKADDLRRGAQVYRDVSGEFSRSTASIMFALAEALDYIAFLKDLDHKAKGEL